MTLKLRQLKPELQRGRMLTLEDDDQHQFRDNNNTLPTKINTKNILV